MNDVVRSKVEKVKPAPRRVSQGDTAPSITPGGIERHTVSETTRAAREAKINAVRDIITGVPPHDVGTLAEVLQAIMDGTSSDDATALRNALMGNPVEGEQPTAEPAPDDQLSEDWR
ncbi:MAG: hypothetical protein KDA75_20175, partial [Planctomycetaceae bacterium]|nr:hypothetical protein [Planctomycetaceae bacterium]